jgi:hypothetical protein
MSRLKLLLSLFMLMGLTLSAAPVAAQEGTPSALDDPGLLEGIELAIARDWSIDFEAMMATPEAEMDQDGLMLVSALAMRFDSDENAAAAYEIYRTQGIASLTSDMDVEGEEAVVTEQELDLGDESYQVDMIATTEESEGAVTVSFAREGNHVYLVSAISLDLESSALASDILDYMVNEAEPADGEGNFNEDGGSEGGLWDVFPPNDYPALTGLIPGGDELAYPAPDTGA